MGRTVFHGFSTLFNTSEGSPAPKALQEGGRPAPPGALLCSGLGLRCVFLLAWTGFFERLTPSSKLVTILRPPRHFANARPDISKPFSVNGRRFGESTILETRGALPQLDPTFPSPSLSLDTDLGCKTKITPTGGRTPYWRRGVCSDPERCRDDATISGTYSRFGTRPPLGFRV